jgi:hypothetical protein
MRRLGDLTRSSREQDMRRHSGFGLRSVAAVLLLSYGVVVLAAALLEFREQAGLSTEQSWSLLHVMTVGVLAIGAVTGRRWALWGVVVLTAAALLMLPPLAFAILGGPARDALVPRIDLMLLIAEAVIFAAVLFLVSRLRSATRT